MFAPSPLAGEEGELLADELYSVVGLSADVPGPCEPSGNGGSCRRPQQVHCSDVDRREKAPHNQEQPTQKRN